MKTALTIISILPLIIMIYLTYRNIKVNIFLNKLLHDVTQASLLRLEHLNKNNKIINVNSTKLFEITDNIKPHHLVFKHPFKKLDYQNILSEKDLKELNYWSNINNLKKNEF